MSTIDNTYARSVSILRFILRALTSSMGFSSYFSCWGIENLDANNKSNESKAETRIELEDKMN